MEPKYGGRLSSQWRNFVTQFANTKYTKYTYSHHTFNANSHTNTRVSSISRFNDMEPKYNGCGGGRLTSCKIQSHTSMPIGKRKYIYLVEQIHVMFPWIRVSLCWTLLLGVDFCGWALSRHRHRLDSRHPGIQINPQNLRHSHILSHSRRFREIFARTLIELGKFSDCSWQKKQQFFYLE